MSVQTGIGVRGAEAQAGEQRGRVTIVRPPGSLGKGVRGDCGPAASAPPSIRVPLGQALWSRAWPVALLSPSFVAFLPLIPGCDLGIVGTVLKPSFSFHPPWGLVACESAFVVEKRSS